MKKILLVLAIAAVVGLTVGGIMFHRAMEATRDAYAVWWVAGMVVEHLDANDNNWPTGWSDLQDDYQTCIARSGQPWTFEELRERVEIDWSTDPDDLLAKSRAGEPIRVIRLRNGKNTHWDGLQPNEIVLNYLTRRAATQPASSSTAPAGP